MMPYQRLIKVRLADGTLDARIYANGLVSECPEQGTSFSLGMRRGCLGGLLSLVRAPRQAFRLDVGQIVEFWYDASTLVYAGVIVERRDRLTDNVHEYELEGWWANLLKSVQLTRAVELDVDGTITTDTTAPQRIVFGSDVAEDDDGSTTGERRVAGCATPEAIVRWLATAYLAPLGITCPPADIVDSGVAVASFVIPEGMTFYQAIEELEILASAKAAGDWYYVSGIDAGKNFYFLPVSTADAALQGTYTIGENLQDGERAERGAAVTNSIAIVGAMQDAKGQMFKRGYRYKPSVDRVGLRPQKPIGVPSLRKEADARKFALGFFRRQAPALATAGTAEAAAEATVFSAVRRVHAQGEAAALPVPHRGQLAIADATDGALKQDFLQQLDVAWGAAPDLTATLGADSPESAAGSYYGAAPESQLTIWDSEGWGGGGPDSLDSAWLSSLPESTDLIDAYADAPALSGPEIPYTGLPGSLDPLATDFSKDYGQDAAIKADLADLKSQVGTGDVAKSALWPAGSIVSLQPPAALAVKEGEALKLTALVSNGRQVDALVEENSPIFFQYHFEGDDGTTKLDGILFASRLSVDQDAGLEVWQSVTAIRLRVFGVPTDDPTLCPNGMYVPAGTQNGKPAYRRERDASWWLWYEGQSGGVYYWRLSQTKGDAALSWRLATAAETLETALAAGDLSSVSTSGGVPVYNGSPAVATLRRVADTVKLEGTTTPAAAGTYQLAGESAGAPAYTATVGGTTWWLYQYPGDTPEAALWMISATLGIDSRLSTDPGWNEVAGSMLANLYASGSMQLTPQYQQAGQFATPGVAWVAACAVALDPSAQPELLSGTGWTASGWTGNFSSGFTSTAPNTLTLSHTVAGVAAGKKYLVTTTLSGRTAGSLTVSLGGKSIILSQDGELTSPITAVSSSGLAVTPTSDFTGTLKLSVKEAPDLATAAARYFPADLSGVSQAAAGTDNLLTADGWTSDGWTGEFSMGFTNLSNNTQPLTHDLAGAAAGKVYQVQLTVSGRNAGSITLNVAGCAATLQNGTFTLQATATTAAGLTITPTADFDGTVSGLSVVEAAGTQQAGFGNWKEGVPVRVFSLGGTGGSVYIGTGFTA